MDFTGKVAMVTGASVGIGWATALRFAQQGAKLSLLDVNMEQLEKVKEKLAEYTKDVLIFNCDVSDDAAVRQAVDATLQAFGQIDILVNNAALWRHRQPFAEIPDEIWKTYWNINVMGVVYCSRAVLPGMLERQSGSIVNVASVAGVYGNANMSCYSATKGAVIALTQALAKEVADKGVRVNAISPGTVSSSAVEDIRHYDPSDRCYMKRTGSDLENANTICFLASDEAPYLSGQNIQVDGVRKHI